MPNKSYWDDEEYCLEQVKHNAFSIQHIKNPSEQVQLECVKQDGNCIRYINNPTEQVQIESVKRNIFYIQYIENPTEAAILTALQNGLELHHLIKISSEKLNIFKEKYPEYFI